MINIGCHLSTSGGFLAMAKHASELGADTFAFFTRNPRGGAAKEVDPADAEAMMEYLREHNFGKLVAHGAYTMNICAEKMNVREFAWQALKDDIKRMEMIPGNYYNFHPGSHVGQGPEVAIPLIARALNEAMIPDQSTTVLLECMAGKGSEVGRNFEEIRAIIDKVENNDKLGVCMDSCHIWDGGYDIVGELDKVLWEFDDVIGLDRLKAIHINDSMNELGAAKDRHAKIGEGKIGLEGLKAFATHPKLAGKPFILETPNDDEGYAREIALIRSWF
ncbi:MAG: deoxyribonuclease IV [Lachnospiraceae bacterium]|nr:deoxyribonuclease IV [Lachnospiraceae bacterium]